MADTQEFWFVARTRKNQELSVRDSLKKMNVETFLPTHVVVRQLKYRRKRVEVPVIRNMIFVRATKEFACSIANDYSIPLFYIKDLTTRSMLVVPDRQMQDFMFVMDKDPAGLRYEEDITFLPGEKVQVVKGEFCGIEGEMVSEANKTYVVIRIPQLLSVSVRVRKGWLKRV